MKKVYPSIEKTFVMIKPDAVSRGIVGNIFQRFEEQGLKLIASRMVMATKEQAALHYPSKNKKWLENIGNKTYEGYGGNTKEILKDLKTIDKLKIGQRVYDEMVKYITGGPVVIMVWEGNHAVERVRKLVGSTLPTFAEVGSIRGSYAFDTPALATKSGRITFKTLIHASDSPSEAEREITIWFGNKYKNLGDYERVDYIDIL
jgi:nucleoside-diphosphate kinase